MGRPGHSPVRARLLERLVRAEIAAVERADADADGICMGKADISGEIDGTGVAATYEAVTGDAGAPRAHQLGVRQHAGGHRKDRGS